MKVDLSWKEIFAITESIDHFLTCSNYPNDDICKDLEKLLVKFKIIADTS